MYRNPNCAQKKGTEPSPVELLKAEAASIVVVDLMNRILQNLPSLFSVFGVHLHLVFKGLYLEILLLSLIHLGRGGVAILPASAIQIRRREEMEQSISPSLRRQGRERNRDAFRGHTPQFATSRAAERTGARGRGRQYEELDGDATTDGFHDHPSQNNANNSNKDESGR